MELLARSTAFFVGWCACPYGTALVPHLPAVRVRPAGLTATALALRPSSHWVRAMFFAAALLPSNGLNPPIFGQWLVRQRS